jgi:anti-sigma factor RsiW
MSAANDHVPGLLDDYVHGVLSEREAGRVEAHCADCPECRARLDEARQFQAALQSVPPTEATPALIETTLRRVHDHDRLRRRRLLRVFLGVVSGAAAATLLLGLLQLHYQHLAASTYDLVVLGQRELLAATTASLRVRLFDRSNGRPLGGVPVWVELRRGGEAIELARFDTDEHGTGRPRLELPDWPDGDGQLRVVARAPGGDEEVVQPVRLHRSWKLMLSSDKPVYQPGQTVHVRSLALRRPDLRPVAGQPAVFTLTDPRGNVIFKEKHASSRFGIASADCALDPDLAEGAYTLACKLGDTESRLAVEVKRYVLPKFKIEVGFDRPFYQPQQQAHLSVRADYFFGKPVDRGDVRVEVRGPDGHVLAKLADRTDRRGEAKLTWTAPDTVFGAEEARLAFDVTVADGAGQEQTRRTERVLTTQPIRVEVVPEGGDLVSGVANRVYFFVRSADGAPVRARLSVRGIGQNTELKTDAQGLTSCDYTPQAGGGSLDVRVLDDAGKELASRRADLRGGYGPVDFLLRTDRAVYRSGETMRLTALGGGREPVFVDLLKDGQTLLTQVIDVDGGRGELTFDLPPELSGTLQVCAFRFNPSGVALRKTRVLYVRPADQVRVTATPDAPEYRPGGKATVRFTLADSSGRPVPGALSLSAVDEAVFSVLPQRPGMEQTFYLLEHELLQPVYAIYPWVPGSGSEVLEQALFARTTRIEGGSQAGPTPASHTLSADSYPEKKDRTAVAREKGLERVRFGWVALLVAGLLAGYAALWCLVSFRLVVAMHASGVLVLAIFAALVFVLGRQAGSMFAPVGRAQLGVEVLAEAQAVRRLADGEPLMPRMKELDGAVSMAPADDAAAPRVRERFPETMLWRPELVTDDQGRASLEMDLADAITTWRLAAGAVTGDGRLGSAQVPLKVFQPFFADLNLPVSLTRGDEVAVPVVVYNYLDRPQTVTLSLRIAGGLALQGDAERRLDLAAGEVRSVPVRLRARDVGTHSLEVTARGSGIADALRRTVEVIPDGRPVEQVVSGTLDRPASVALDLPADAIPGSGHATLKVYPSGFSQLVEGLENIFQMPNGCFEQTSSTTYPNVLALDYLRRTNKQVPAVEARARQFIHLGYQRLVGFEVSGGGFDWFGRPPANVTLTAYGLMEFEDMARVHDVDGALIDRTRRWLLAQRRPDGSWQPQQGIFHDDLTGGADAEERLLGTTAYIAWAVFAGDRAPNDAPATRAFLLRHRPDTIRDPHVLALVCNALLAVDPRGQEAGPYLDRLESLRHKSPDGRLAWWEQPAGARTCFYGCGQSGQIETTALAALALIEAHRPAPVRPALAWLVSQKDAQGTWHSTQATVLALRALLSGTGAALGGGEARRVEVRLDGQAVREVTIPGDHDDVLTRVDLTPFVAPGRRVEVVQTSGPASGYQVSFRYHVAGPAKVVPDAGPLTVVLDYDRTELALGEALRARVRLTNNRPSPAPMVLLDLPVPPGFAPDADDFTALVRQGKIDRFQVRPRQVLVYLRGLLPDKPLELTYRLRPALAGSVAVPGAHAYEYYAPEVGGRSPATRLTVKPRG